MLHFRKVHTLLFYNNKTLYQQVLTQLKYNIKINVWYYPKSSSEINGNEQVEIGIYLLHWDEMISYQKKLTKSFFQGFPCSMSSIEENNIEFQ